MDVAALILSREDASGVRSADALFQRIRELILSG